MPATDRNHQRTPDDRDTVPRVSTVSGFNTRPVAPGGQMDARDSITAARDSLGALASRPAWIPADVSVVFAYTVLAGGLLAWTPAGLEPVTTAVGVPFVLFLPGYALLSAAFPERTTRPGSSLARGRLAWVDRVALSFGTSLTIIPVVGLAVAAAGYPFAPRVLFGALAAVVVPGMLVGAVRRLRLPEQRRYAVPYDDWAREARRALDPRDEPLDAALNGTVLALALLTLVVLGVALVAPPAAESYTGFELLAEGEDGALVANEYPREFTVGEERAIYVSVENDEGRRVTYTVVGEVQRVDASGDSVTILERDRVDAFSVTVEPGETVRERRALATDMTGEDLRLVYYLYAGDAPADPDAESAYRHVYIWIDAEPPGDAE